MELPKKIKYWVHMLFELDTLTMENKFIKGYVQPLKEQVQENNENEFDFEVKKEGEVRI